MEKWEVELTSVFNQYVKLRDTDQYGNGFCIDTGKRIFYKRQDGRWISNCDAGHYISREVRTICWNELNVHAQFYLSNRSQIFTNYRHNLSRKIGMENVLWLEQQKNDWGMGWYEPPDYDMLIAEYQEKIKLILKEKMF